MKYICNTIEELNENLRDSYRAGDIFICSDEVFEYLKKHQPESSKREDPHINLEDIESMTIDQMKVRMKEMEDIILRQYIQMTTWWICPNCVGCGTPNPMET